MRRRRPPHDDAAAAEPSKDAPEPVADHLLQLVHAPGVLWFRRAFAAAICHGAWQMARRQEMHDFFGAPARLTLAYEWAPRWLRPLDASCMTWLPHVHAASAVAFGTGAAPRAGLLVFTLTYTFLFVCDASRYVNHYYLYCLLGALLLAAACGGDGRCEVRRVHVWLLRAQFSLVYAYGGLAKCSSEFVVRGEPLRTYVLAALRAEPAAPGLRQLRGVIDAEWAILAGAAFALAFDLAAAVLLWHPRWRWRAAAVGACFHGANAVLFTTIGSFPYVSMASCALFLDAAPAPPASRSSGRQRRAAPTPPSAATSTLALSAAWLAWQALVPLRAVYPPADVSWSKRGDRFSWRMMADTTDGFVTLWISDPTDGRSFPVHPRSSDAPVTLNAHSIQQLLAAPALLEQWIGAEVAAASRALGAPEAGSRALRVTADCWKSINRRPFQRWCEPGFDFGGAGRPLPAGAHPWMLPRRTLPDGGAGEAEAAATAAAGVWRARGFKVEAFVDIGGRAEWRDRVLRSAGHSSADIVVCHAGVTLTLMAADGQAAVRVLTAGETAPLRIGEWHSVRAADAPSLEASWLYVMK